MFSIIFVSHRGFYLTEKRKYLLFLPCCRGGHNEAVSYLAKIWPDLNKCDQTENNGFSVWNPHPILMAVQEESNLRNDTFLSTHCPKEILSRMNLGTFLLWLEDAAILVYKNTFLHPQPYPYRKKKYHFYVSMWTC